MKKELISVLILLLIPLMSSSIILNEKPLDLYNLGETIDIPVKIATTADIQGIFHMHVICNGVQEEFYKNGINLKSGEEKILNPTLLLSKEIVGGLTGECKIKASLKDEFVLTEEFFVSNLITIEIDTQESEFNPESSISIQGKAIKQNGNFVEGFVDIEVPGTENENSTRMIITDTVKNGYFSVNFSFPKKIAAGKYTLIIRGYEKNLNGDMTNQGQTNYNLAIRQVPTTLEVFFETQKIEPGANLSIKTILHDQTGEKIDSVAIITIKDMKGKILEQKKMATDELLEFPIKYNQAPEKWKVLAESNQLTSESTLEIVKKKDIRIQLINKTLILTNIGNVPYNDTLIVKIGNDVLNINVDLEVDKEKRYLLTAPDGEYPIEIIANEGSRITGDAVLTGKTVAIKEMGGLGFVRYSIVWIFITAVLGFMAFMVFRKGYKRSFFGRANLKEREEKEFPLRKDSIISTANRAELSLSIKGDKQNVSLVSLRIKNLQEIQSKKSGAEEILQKMVNLAEEKKAAIYENQNNIFFILAPARTKTFKNEKTVLELAQRIKHGLESYNKMAKQKIDFGISLNYGTMVAKQERDLFKFMSMGTLISGAKRLSLISEGEILLGEKIKERLISEVKTEKQRRDGVDVYVLVDVKDRDAHGKFIGEFVKRMERK